jgi:hypothetical protein
LPLAIRIAASRLVSRPAWKVAALARRLRDERRRLSELALGDLAVRTSFQVSYSTLAAGDGGRAFRLLGLWPGADISLLAAAALLGVPAESASQMLERLVDVHMLETPAADRYRFHDLIGVFAAECADLDEPLASRQASVGRILRWYLHSADVALKELGLFNRADLTMVPAETQALPLTFVSKDASAQWCENERDNMVSAVGLARRNAGPEICAQLAEVSFRWFRRSPWGGWLEVLQQGIDCADGLDDAAPRAWLRCFLGITKTLLGRYLEAIEHLEETLELSRMTGNRACEALAIGNLAIAYKELKRYDDAIVSLEQVLVIDPQAALPGMSWSISARCISRSASSTRELLAWRMLSRCSVPRPTCKGRACAGRCSPALTSSWAGPAMRSGPPSGLWRSASACTTSTSRRPPGRSSASPWRRTGAPNGLGTAWTGRCG